MSYFPKKVFIITVSFLIWITGCSPLTFPATADYSNDFDTFYKNVLDRKITSVVIKGNILTGMNQQGYPFKTIIPLDGQYELAKELRNNGIIVEFKESASSNGWRMLFFSIAIQLILLVSFFFLIRRSAKSGGGVSAFGKSRAKLFSESTREKVTFQDVAGIDEAKEELQEVIEFLKNPAKFKKLGGRIPRGVLLIGPPGTGKTLLARAVAGEADVPFFYTSGSEFTELYIGVGPSRVRNLFTDAQKNAPAIVFIDEIDAAGRRRNAQTSGAGQEQENTLNQILVEMDGFETNNGVLMKKLIFF